MTPRDVLERARSEKFTWVDYDADDTAFDAGPRTVRINPSSSSPHSRTLRSRSSKRSFRTNSLLTSRTCWHSLPVSTSALMRSRSTGTTSGATTFYCPT